MITLKNNATKYADLFKKAWNELYHRGKFTTREELEYYGAQGRTFKTLEDYFMYIETLVTLDKRGETYPATLSLGYNVNGEIEANVDNGEYGGKAVRLNYEFIMLPLDEPRFSIDANTRDIIIPANFKKLVGVQGDHSAETLIFDIDRYFDFVDLYRDDMEI
jgi:hypothetical protein